MPIILIMVVVIFHCGKCIRSCNYIILTYNSFVTWLVYVVG